VTTPKRHRGRPATTGRGHDGPRLTVRFTRDEMERLEAAAADRHMSAAAFVREVVMDAVEAKPAP